LEINGCDSIEKAFQKFTRPETLDNENKYKCPRCSKKVRATKRFTIKKSPNILTIQLKRFKFGFGGFGGKGGKINKSISFPERLNIKQFQSQPTENSNYRLYAVLVHSGHSINSGHYYCYIKNSIDIWYCMNDSSVTKSSINNVLKQEAYILFYARDVSSIPKQILQKRKIEETKESEMIKMKSNDNNQQNESINKKQKIITSPQSPQLKPKLQLNGHPNGNGKSEVVKLEQSPSKSSVPIMKKLETEHMKNQKKSEEFLNNLKLNLINSENSKKKSKKNPNDNSSQNVNSVSGSSDEDSNIQKKIFQIENTFTYR